MKNTQIIKTIAGINFYISALLLIAGGILSVSGHYSMFFFNEDLYGALENNLRMSMVYLAVSEFFLACFCIFKKNFRIMIAVGLFLITIIGSLAFYGEINAVEIDPNLPLFFLYVGLSHIIFGVLDKPEKTR